MTPGLAERLFGEFARRAPAAAPMADMGPEALTERKHEVRELLARGT
jgi:hypothetical protein